MNQLTLNISRFLFLLAFALIVPSTWAQYNKAFYEQLKQEYANHNLVQLSNKYHYKLDLVDGQIQARIEKEESFIILKHSLGSAFNQSVYTSVFKELEDFEANIYVYDGKRYKKKPVKTYTEKSNHEGSSFHDDIKECNFLFPGATNGSVVELKTSYTLKDSRILPSVFLNDGLPTRDFEFKLSAHKDIQLDLVEFNMEDIGSNIVKEQDSQDQVYSLKLEKLEGIFPETSAPSIRYYTPHIVPIIRNYSYQGLTLPVLDNPKSLYKWYQTFVDDLYQGVEMEGLKQIADSLTAQCISEEEKVAQLYYWVQRNIKYIAFEYGLGGLIPRKPDQVLKQRYGDCKDNTAILHALLKSQGIESSLTWIGTDDLPYSYAEVSSPVSDNHMILTYFDTKGKAHFLDATGKYQWFSIPTSFIQGKEALVAIDEENFKIIEVPEVSAATNLMRDSIYMEINNGNISGSGLKEYGGYWNIDAHYRLVDESDKRQKELLEAFLEKGSNRFVLKEYVLPEMSSFDSILNIAYSFQLDNYVKSVAGKKYLNMNLYQDWIEGQPKKDRKQPYAIRFKNSRSITYVLQLPKNYKLEFMPEDSHYKNAFCQFDIRYERRGDKLIYTHFIKVDKRLIGLEDLYEYTDFFKELEKAYKQTVVFSQE